MTIRTIGGHPTEPTGKIIKGYPGSPVELRCTKCETVGDSLVFSVGLTGCPADPTSFRLSVCVGGEQCKGHPDTDSAEWRAYKESPTLSLEGVPHWFHGTDDLAERAASHYRQYADRVGLRTGVWAQEGFKVGPEGGMVAEMTFIGLSWSVHVDRYGKITARLGN